MGVADTIEFLTQEKGVDVLEATVFNLKHGGNNKT